MLVSDMMRRNLVTIPPDTAFEKLVRLQACMPARQIYVTTPDGMLLGLITCYDVLASMAPFYLDSNLAKALPDGASVFRHAFEANRGKTAKEVMTSEPAVLKMSDTFLEADVLIREQGTNVLPVVDEKGRLVGEVTRKVVLRYIATRVLGLTCDKAEG